MTDRLAVTLTVEEFEALIALAVHKALDEREGDFMRVSDLASEEMTLADVMTLFHVGASKTIWRWRRSQGFPAPRKTGGRVRWIRAEVNQWRAAREASGPGAVMTPPGRRRKSMEDSGALAPR